MKTRFYCILVLLACSITLYAQGYQWEKAISYREGKQNAYMKQKCLLDVYYPTDKKDFPTVVWFHGGGLTGGDREIPRELREQGIAVVGVSYRLCAGNKDPKAINADVTTDDAVDDAAAAPVLGSKLRPYTGLLTGWPARPQPLRGRLRRTRRCPPPAHRHRLPRTGVR